MNFLKNIPVSSTDAELVNLYKSTDNADFLAALYQRYMDMIYGVCLKYLKNEEAAKDSVMEIYMELVDKLKKYSVENFKSWVYQLAKNHCLMKLRKDKNKPHHIDADVVHLEDNVHLNAVMEKEANLNLLHDCIQELNVDQREIIELFYLKEQCYKSIAEFKEIELNTVRSFIQNGRRNLKNCMEKKSKEIQ